MRPEVSRSDDDRMHQLRTGISLIAVAALAVAACGGDDDTASPATNPRTTSAAPAATADTGGSDAPATDATPASPSSGGTYTAIDVCRALDPADIEAQIAPVKEIQEVDDRYCTVVLDREGMGNMLNISVEIPIEGMGMDDPADLYAATVRGRSIMAGDVEAVPVAGLGEEAAAIAGDAGHVIVVRIGDSVVHFDPFLSDGEMTLDMWKAVLEPAIARL